MMIDPNTGEILDGHSSFGRCIFCGQITQDWWYMDYGNGNECRCRSCYSLGRSLTPEEISHHEKVNEISTLTPLSSKRRAGSAGKPADPHSRPSLVLAKRAIFPRR